MDTPEPSITVAVDPTNPGQFFACCGLLELADRLWPGAEGWFGNDGQQFHVVCQGTLSEFVKSLARARLIHDMPADPYSSPVTIAEPFRPLRIDWWVTDLTGAKDLKVWAGTMESFGIARAMQAALTLPQFMTGDLFNVGMVVSNPDDPSKKKEPYYFDSRRAANAHSRDVGFSPNDLSLTTIAHPAVELLCLIGLQVARPDGAAFSRRNRLYDYSMWSIPLPSNLLLAASCGRLRIGSRPRYRFENWFRTGQKKHKAFRPGILVTSGD